MTHWRSVFPGSRPVRDQWPSAVLSGDLDDIVVRAFSIKSTPPFNVQPAFQDSPTLMSNLNCPVGDFEHITRIAPADQSTIFTCLIQSRDVGFNRNVDNPSQHYLHHHSRLLHMVGHAYSELLREASNRSVLWQKWATTRAGLVPP